MRSIKRIVAFGACVMLLSACSQKYEALTPDVRTNMLADLKAGKLTLDCTLNCSFTWFQQAGAVHAMDMAERWDDLAIKVMQIGYQQDLTYYYLGQAAQGLGYHDAAIKYYKYAAALATGQSTTDQCAAHAIDQRDPCQGVNIPAVVPVLIKVSQDTLDAQAAQARQAAAPSPPPAKPPVPKKAAPAGPNWAVPPPPPQ